MLTAVLIMIAATVATAIVWGSLLDIAYHQGLPTSGAEESSRSLECDRFGFWVLNGENRHAEHHAYPQIPLPNWRYVYPILKPILLAKGAVFERGYVSTLIKGLVRCPFLLPPPERLPEGERSWASSAPRSVDSLPTAWPFATDVSAETWAV